MDADGKAYVIHVWPDGDELVRIEPLDTFTAGIEHLAIYRMLSISKETRERAAHVALAWVGTRQFDKDFDLSSDDALYCTELVYKAYQSVGVDITSGEFNKINIPLWGRKEVIYPSLIIESGLFVSIYSR